MGFQFYKIKKISLNSAWLVIGLVSAGLGAYLLSSQHSPKINYSQNIRVIKEINPHEMKPFISSATTLEGQKIIVGKILLADNTTKAFYDIKKTDLDRFGVFIYNHKNHKLGQSPLEINHNGQAKFYFKAPAEPGGLISARLFDKKTQSLVGQLADFIHNSTFTVDSTGDEVDLALDGVCQTASGSCTFRAALMEANFVAGADSISFNIPLTDPGWDATKQTFVIGYGDPYINIAEQITIDGTTQTSFTGDTNKPVAEPVQMPVVGQATTGPEIIIDFSSFTLTYPLRFAGSNTLIKGLGFYNNDSGKRRVLWFYNGINSQVQDCDFVNNEAAVYISNNAKDIHFDGNVFRDNIGQFAFDLIESNVPGGSITNNQFVNNQNKPIGLLFNSVSATVTNIEGNLFKANGLWSTDESLNSGAAIYIASPNAEFIIKNNNFIHNNNGAIEVAEYTVGSWPNYITMIQNTFIGNRTLEQNLRTENEGLALPTPNDVGDADSGSNHLQNFPVIQQVEYLGGGQYNIKGVIDNTVPSEGPFDLEICLGNTPKNGQSGCLSSIFFQENAVSQNLGDLSHWSTIITLPGDDGNTPINLISSATNSYGSTSEFSPSFITTPTNLDYIKYAVELESPINNQVLYHSKPLFVWQPAADQETGHIAKQVDHYEVLIDGKSYQTLPGAATTSWQITQSLSSGSHSWEVIAWRIDPITSQKIALARSQVESFRIFLVAPRPIIPILPPTPAEPEEESDIELDDDYSFLPISPIDVLIDDTTPFFDWEDLPAEASFDYYSLFINGQLISSSIDNSHFQLPENLALEEGQHFWYVVAMKKDLSEVSRTKVVSFEIDIPKEQQLFFPDLPIERFLNNNNEEPSLADPTPPIEPTARIDTTVSYSKKSFYEIIPFFMANLLALGGSLLFVSSSGLSLGMRFLLGFWVPKLSKDYGLVMDEKTKKPLALALVKLSSKLENYQSTLTDSHGRYFLSTSLRGQLELEAQCPGWQSSKIDISVQADIIKKDVYLTTLDTHDTKVNFVVTHREFWLKTIRLITTICFIIGFVWSFWSLLQSVDLIYNWLIMLLYLISLCFATIKKAIS